jgi:hypothetical protein
MLSHSVGIPVQIFRDLSQEPFDAQQREPKHKSYDMAL